MALSKLSTSQIAVIFLALATALIHLSRALADEEIGVLFGLNALGYVLLVVALYLPVPQLTGARRLIRRLLMGYTALTIVLYLVWGMMSGEWLFPIGPLDKAIEVALLILLWVEDRATAPARMAQNPTRTP